MYYFSHVYMGLLYAESFSLRPVTQMPITEFKNDFYLISSLLLIQEKKGASPAHVAGYNINLTKSKIIYQN